MRSLTDLRAAVAAKLADLDGRVLVYPGRTEYRRGDIEELRLMIRITVGPGHDEQGMARLDEMLAPDGPSSVKARLDEDDTLGGLVSDLSVASASGHLTFPAQGAPSQLGCEWTVRILP